MAPIFLFLALVLQCSFILAEPEVSESHEAIITEPEIDDDTVTNFSTDQKDWIDMFTHPNSNMYVGPSAAMMAQITNSNKTAEEQIEDIKEIAQQIASAIEAEMMSFFSFAMANSETETDENGLRKKRSTETPMDSTQMVMRLLKHIKSNNDYQNVAIDKMLSAQEIAEKFGIEFNPDPEILSDLAMAANDHALEMTNILKNACDLSNATDKVEFIPIIEEPSKENETFYVYGVHNKDEDVPTFEYVPDIISKSPVNHNHFTDSSPYYSCLESQISAPPAHHHHSVPVTPKPSFYDSFMYPFSPASDIYSPYTLEPLMPGLLIPIEDPEPEPELVGEEVEETITTRMLVEKGDDPGSTTVNHVTSYTISEKSHFKPPHIEKLPQQFQYCFFLM